MFIYHTGAGLDATHDTEQAPASVTKGLSGVASSYDFERKKVVGNAKDKDAKRDGVAVSPLRTQSRQTDGLRSAQPSAVDDEDSQDDFLDVFKNENGDSEEEEEEDDDDDEGNAKQGFDVWAAMAAT